MTYQKGTASSSFDLFEKIDTFIRSLSGWQLWADIAQYDKVYFSSGEDGYNDIYIRVKAAADERYMFGLDQNPLDPSGDTGYINFFAYNYYPQAGDGYAGFGEIGILGPRFYHFTLNRRSSIGGTTREETVARVYHTNMLSQKPGGGAKGVGEAVTVPGGGLSGYGYSPTTVERKRWTNMSRAGYGVNKRFFGLDAMAWDGKRYFYHSATSFQGFSRYSIARFGGANEGIAEQGQGIGIFHNDLDTIDTSAYRCYIVTLDPQTRNEMFYYMDSGGLTWSVRNLDTDAVTALNVPGYSGSTVSNTIMAWDGADKIYHLRGVSTTEWAIYSISANTWTLGSSVLPNNSSASQNFQVIFVPQHISGAANNRLYHISDGTLYYINLDNDSGFIASGASWTSAGAILGSGSDTQIYRQSFMWINRYGRMFVHGSGSDIDDILDKGTTTTDAAASDGRPMVYTDSILSPNWKVADPFWLPDTLQPNSNSGSTFGGYMDGYQARVRTSMAGSTLYHLIGDDDRIIVATEADGISTVCYAGGFEPHSDDDAVGTLDHAIPAGFSQRVRVRNTRGDFTPGRGYFIMDTNAGYGFTNTHPIEGIKRKLVNSESVTVTSVTPDQDGYILTFSNRFAYPAGAKIGVDPQPVGLLLGDLQKFQTTNNIPGQYDDLSGTDDRASQVYSMCTNDEVVGVGTNSRSSTKIAWPANFGTFESEGFFEGQEMRGSMKDVLVGPAFDTGQTINIDGKAYVAIKPKNFFTDYLIGLLED